MTDNKKLTDNELEQVVGGDIIIPNFGSGFSAGNYVVKNKFGAATTDNSEIVYKIESILGSSATATKYERDNADVVRTTFGCPIDLGDGYTTIPKPGWVPAN